MVCIQRDGAAIGVVGGNGRPIIIHRGCLSNLPAAEVLVPFPVLGVVLFVKGLSFDERVGGGGRQGLIHQFCWWDDRHDDAKMWMLAGVQW
jgi:hypothetical protein